MQVALTRFTPRKGHIMSDNMTLRDAILLALTDTPQSRRDLAQSLSGGKRKTLSYYEVIKLNELVEAGEAEVSTEAMGVVRKRQLYKLAKKS